MKGRRVATKPKAGSGGHLTLPIAVLAPDPKNPRRMPDESAAGLAISLETFGALDIGKGARADG